MIVIDDYPPTGRCRFLVAESLVHAWSISRRYRVRDDKGRGDLAFLHPLQQIVGPPVDMGSTHFPGETLVHGSAEPELQCDVTSVEAGHRTAVNSAVVASRCKAEWSRLGWRGRREAARGVARGMLHLKHCRGWPGRARRVLSNANVRNSNWRNQHGRQRNNAQPDKPGWTDRRMRVRSRAVSRQCRTAARLAVPLHDVPSCARQRVRRICDVRARRGRVLRSDSCLGKLARRTTIFLSNLRVRCLHGICRKR